MYDADKLAVALVMATDLSRYGATRNGLISYSFNALREGAEKAGIEDFPEHARPVFARLRDWGFEPVASKEDGAKMGAPLLKVVRIIAYANLRIQD